MKRDEKMIPWTKEQLMKANNKLMAKVVALNMDKEDMYQLATRAEFDDNDWSEFERIFDKNK